ncbi:MAG: HAMP domain-containing histidine kinase [Ruminococcaceae bacterium]|nr:HAMP domain-containing histidine kinase [Oscillospiraceae bacterium]
MKKQKKKEARALTLIYAILFFAIQCLALAMAALVLYILTHLGIINEARDNTLLIMASSSLVVGMLLTVFTRAIPLGPLNRAIQQLNRLASGDYSARMQLRKPLSSSPELAEFADSFNKMAQELENTQLLRSDFVNNFSHEFKTPIVSIAGFAKLLRRGNLTKAQQEEYLQIIEDESLRLAAMATNMMHLTNVENQEILTNITHFNLSEQLRSCMLLLEKQWSEKDILPDMEFAEHTICGNEELLRQVWINLFQNAIKFSPRKSDVLVRISAQPDTLSVSVINCGADIPPEKLPRIFQKFYQADESHAESGNGIGLAIVKRIVELHKGSVSAKSQNGITSFCVTLPRTALEEKQ